ncbi:MAG: phage portal protein [Defluviitaleaceae bacterium]|nr:phage portal protein [Defluviitaleaceae bacterium]
MIQLKCSFFDGSMDKEKIEKLLKCSKGILGKRQSLYNRYTRIKSPADMMAGQNGNTLAAWEYYIIHMADGCFGGVAPQYKAMGDNSELYQEQIDNIRRFNDDSDVFANLIHYFNTTSAAYLYIGENGDNEIEYEVLNPLNTIVIYDYGIRPKPVAAILFRTEDNEQILEIITAKRRIIRNSKGEAIAFSDYDENGNEAEMYEKQLFWDELPIIPFERKDPIALYEPVLPLIDQFEQMLTNIKNTTQYNDNAILVMMGYRPEHPEHISDADGNVIPNPEAQKEDSRLHNASTFYLQDGGDARWLIKDVPYSGIIQFLRELISLILMLSITPNLSDQNFSGNTSGIAHGYKLFAPEQLGATIYEVFRRGYLALWRLITSRLNTRNQSNYNFRDIDIKFTQNIPTDENQRALMLTNLVRFNAVSQETAIRIAAQILGVDASEEINKVLDEDGLKP